MRTLTQTTLMSALALGALWGCNRQTKVESSASTARPHHPASRQVVVAAATPSAAATLDSRQCAMRTVYFAFDDDRLDEDARATISEAVACLTRRKTDARLMLVGATDPRGTEEYNLALGDRRARSVQGYLSAQGINDKRISVHSVGEEQAVGIDDEGWAKDRQVAATVQE